MNKYYSVQFAQVYSEGAYGACAYQDTTSCGTSTGGGPGTTTPGAGAHGLVNTGFIVLVIATIACLLIFAAFIVKFWRKPRKLVPDQIKVDRIDARR